ncbi:AraC family transcriptional regulator [Bradyrhizobium sp. ARR65]|uniref:helix-turn-helix domain-containing protein n=1 Tax=Bradyrhizobium sp. ARR65 TaxID=1040989 RepID=UPI0009FBD41B|nr:AraC family transcriptional regulator [Bradyrhizobium sp. ARR65]
MTRNSSMELQTHGARKYPASALLQSSAGLGWSTLSAELRSHGISETPVVLPLHMELTLAVCGNDDGLVSRTGAGQRQQTIPTTGTIWMTPIAVGDNEISISAALPKMLHLYLPTALFGRLSDDFNLPGAPAHSIRYAAGIRDEMIGQIGLSVLSEMGNETAVGRMYVETASLMLAARVLQKYSDSGSCMPIGTASQSACQVRLRRVLDYIATHIADEIALSDLAEVAGLSLFHFTRMFTRAIGVSPHRYVSRLRLENAMTEIAAGKLPLVQIALNARFSSQASFTRAFRRATGKTPGEYRRCRRS